MIETTIMAHHFQIQNPISKHEMKNINTKREKKNLHKNILKLRNNFFCLFWNVKLSKVI
jgi:hypothetical protein